MSRTANTPPWTSFWNRWPWWADIDNMDESENRATLMTLHSAKGLEFPKVYLVGMEDGLFPSMMSITADDKSEIEEERRLCYVGITRAREELVMTSARQRMVNGETRYSKPSQFVEELPASAVEFDRLSRPCPGTAALAEAAGAPEVPDGKRTLMRTTPCPGIRAA